MKRKIMNLLVALIAVSTVSTASANTLAERRTNDTGFDGMAFIAGCCFGVRAGAAYNDGKDIHSREWLRLVPIVNIVIAVMDGIDASNGMNNADYVELYGSAFY